jgi:RNA processing factor Prp31
MSGFQILNDGIKATLGVDLSPELTFDHEGTEAIDPNDKHLVLIRGFELAIEDWYKPEFGEFTEFRDSKSDYFDSFMAKWVNSQEVPNRLTITYLDLVTDTLQTILTAYRFITGSQINETDLERLTAWQKANKSLNRLKIAEKEAMNNLIRKQIESEPLSLLIETDLDN